MTPSQRSVLSVISLGLALVPCWGFSAGNGATLGLSISGLKSLRSSVSYRHSSKSSRKGFAVSMVDEQNEQQMRDEALGFLTTETASREELAKQLRKAMWEAEEAEARAAELRARRAGKKPHTPSGNGLSAMLDPMANAMLQEQSDYLRKCPVTEILESLEQTRCGVMQAFSILQPSTLLGIAAIMYAVSVLQLSQ